MIGINGSSRRDGNTTIIISTVFEALEKEGVETSMIQLAEYDISPCRGCFACKGRANCVFTEDGFAEIFGRMVEADGIVLGSPVYSADVSAKMKAFLERGVLWWQLIRGFFAIRSGQQWLLCVVAVE